MPEVDLVQWSASWLKTAGCSEISTDIHTDVDGKVTKFDVIQTVYNKANTPENRLRVQKFNIAALNAEMEVVQVATVTTSDSQSVTAVLEFIGSQRAPAYLINYGAHGYAKFVIDE
jgi:aminopeptidase N